MSFTFDLFQKCFLKGFTEVVAKIPGWFYKLEGEVDVVGCYMNMQGRFPVVFYKGCL